MKLPALNALKVNNRKHILRIIPHILLAYWLIQVPLLAQNTSYANLTCEQRLEKAQELYEQGRLEEVEILLAPCVKMPQDERTKEEAQGRLNNLQQQEAYRLLTNTNLYLDKEKRAEYWIIKLLQTNPEYRLRPDDVQEFINLYKTIRTTPFFIVGGRVAGSLSLIQTTNTYSLDKPNNTGVYTAGFGYNASGIACLPLNTFIDLTAEIGFEGRSYQYENKFFDYAKVSFRESLLSFEFPLYAKVYFGNKYNFNKKFKFFVMGGGIFQLLLQSSAKVSRNDQVSATVQRQVTGPNVNITKLRQANSFAFFVGGGIEYKKSRGNWFVDFRYVQGLNNVVNPENRYINPDLLFKYGYVDNDILINSFKFSVGYLYPLYNPRPKRGKKRYE